MLNLYGLVWKWDNLKVWSCWSQPDGVVGLEIRPAMQSSLAFVDTGLVSQVKSSAHFLLLPPEKPDLSMLCCQVLRGGWCRYCKSFLPIPFHVSFLVSVLHPGSRSYKLSPNFLIYWIVVHVDVYEVTQALESLTFFIIWLESGYNCWWRNLRLNEWCCFVYFPDKLQA